MSEFEVGQDVWFVLMNAARSSKIHRSDNGIYLVNIPAGFTWLLEEEIFSSREALAKHLFPEMFESVDKIIELENRIDELNDILYNITNTNA